MSTAPSVSVVIPTRDRPQLVRTAVASVLSQDYSGPIECLVVSDGDEPDLGGIAAGPGRNLVVLSNERRPGAAGARNTGFQHAHGDLLGLCDDDDTWLPDKLRTQVAALDSDPAAIGVGSGYLIDRGDGAPRERLPPYTQITHRMLLRSRAAEVHPSTLLFRRVRLLCDVGFLDEDVPGSYGEDYDWLLRATASAPLLVVRRALATVRWHPGSFFVARWDVIVAAIEYLTAKHEDFASEPKGQARLFGRLAFANAALGRRAAARAWALRAVRLNPRERRAYLAMAVAFGVVRPMFLTRLASASGKGI